MHQPVARGAALVSGSLNLVIMATVVNTGPIRHRDFVFRS